MGANQSTPGTTPGEQTITPPTPVQFSPALIDRLSSPPPADDDIIRRRLAAESAHLRAQEADILRAITAALEKENLDRDSPRLHSDLLGRDIDDVREKVERSRDKRRHAGQGVERARQGVEQCYLTHQDTPLDCWKQVEAFKAQVAKLEQAFVKSLQ